MLTTLPQPTDRATDRAGGRVGWRADGRMEGRSSYRYAHNTIQCSASSNTVPDNEEIYIEIIVLCIVYTIIRQYQVNTHVQLIYSAGSYCVVLQAFELRRLWVGLNVDFLVYHSD